MFFISAPTTKAESGGLKTAENKFWQKKSQQIFGL